MAVEQKTRCRVALYTMGCKTNQYDSGRIAEQFQAAGFRLVPFSETADVYVINTCTVTKDADREARRVSRRVLGRSPGAVVVATGCYVEVDPRPMQSIAGIRLVGGNNLKPELVQRVCDLLRESIGDLKVERSNHTRALPSPHLASPRSSGVQRTRQVIKVQEGCNHRCAYCVVPYARGAARSRPLAEIVAEIRGHVEAGAREVALTGTCLGAFGQDLSPPVSLAECAAAIAAVAGIERLRISSIEPWDVEPELIDLVADHPALCSHFHLPLQSGDDGVRRRMRRPGATAQFADLVARIRERIPDAGITTDVIVGYPGETDAEFAATSDFCRRMQFSRMHVFRYSPRPFTPAAKQADQVRPAVSEARSRALIRLGEEMGNAFARRWLGSTVRVLVEGPGGSDGLLEGLTESYVRVRFPGDQGRRGEMVDVEALEAQGDRLLGRERTSGSLHLLSHRQGRGGGEHRLPG